MSEISAEEAAYRNEVTAHITQFDDKFRSAKKMFYETVVPYNDFHFFPELCEFYTTS